MKWEHGAYFFLSDKPSRIIFALINVLFGKLLEHLLCSLLHGMGMSKETREQIILKSELSCVGSTTFSYTIFPTQTCEQALGGGREMYGVLKPAWFWRNIVYQRVIIVALAPPLHLSQSNTSTGAGNPAPLLLHCLKSSPKNPKCFLCGWRGVVAASSEDEDVTIHFWGWTKHLVMLFGSPYAFVCVWREKARSALRRNRIPQFWFSTWEVPIQACENLWLLACCLKKVQSFSSFFSHLLPHTSSSSVRDYFSSRRTLIFKIKKSNEDWAVTGGSQNKWEAGFGVFLFFNRQNHFCRCWCYACGFPPLKCCTPVSVPDQRGVT